MSWYGRFISEFYWLNVADYYQFLNMSVRQIVGLKPTNQFSRMFHVHEIEEEQPGMLAHVVKTILFLLYV